jgi:hypothetical protein
MRLAVLMLAAAWVAPQAAADCVPVDWMALDLPGPGNRVEIALETAYPGLDIDRGAGTVTLPSGDRLEYTPARETGLDPALRLDDATIGDQFFYTSPLDFTLRARQRPFHDPGRLRNEAFFRALYFRTEAEARASLATVTYDGQGRAVRFRVTQQHCVHAQLEAALNEIEALGPNMAVYFQNSGGSFNWRRIAGTDRLSTHSFGIAVDLNTELGGYWRWAGVAEGEAAVYDNRIPEEIVRAFERFGFIWGGKWHHFDGMHFEYRPEMIVHARLAGRG